MKYREGTLNERLVLNGELRRFEKAIRNKDKDELISVLKSVGIENPDVDFIMNHTKLRKENLFKRILRFLFNHDPR
ncbi:hypothetical protein FJ651_15560 [Paucihalobacter ruber]|uniref:Uncharacterized protein n=1 Tax=Paucihalobacter ruber TaxID=2567861 RepID=A0A506PDN5_9FLAO|nr:hypothetical protein [Paucihalobacter ruber]TPV31127.1 hypothetical protein FJ651_15560 [Paucihalobacter ruber]